MSHTQIDEKALLEIRIAIHSAWEALHTYNFDFKKAIDEFKKIEPLYKKANPFAKTSFRLDYSQVIKEAGNSLECMLNLNKASGMSYTEFLDRLYEVHKEDLEKKGRVYQLYLRFYLSATIGVLMEKLIEELDIKDIYDHNFIEAEDLKAEELENKKEDKSSLESPFGPSLNLYIISDHINLLKALAETRHSFCLQSVIDILNKVKKEYKKFSKGSVRFNITYEELKRESGDVLPRVAGFYKNQSMDIVRFLELLKDYYSEDMSTEKGKKKRGYHLSSLCFEFVNRIVKDLKKEIEGLTHTNMSYF